MGLIASGGLLLAGLWACSQEATMYRKLTPEEERVIVHKGTEAPFTGQYNSFHEKGTYVCKRCGAPLYRSGDKFDSECGWPSFDEAIPGAVKRVPDADGERTEALCANCGAHLGHVFAGEKLTPKDTRYCVNSVSMSFIPEAVSSGTQQAIFAGGCFWGMEYQFQKVPGVLSTKVGYTGGTKPNPTYEEVCSGRTGHAEALEVTFDPKVTSYEALARRFFEIHDPTEMDRQGPDVGKQYRSVVFYRDEDQKKTAEKLIDILKKKGYAVVTQVVPAGEFYPAEDYHQKYYEKGGGEPYCHLYTKRF